MLLYYGCFQQLGGSEVVYMFIDVLKIIVMNFLILGGNLHFSW